ncbi:hypothetical protein BD626DRAFT_635575 [Schizophyllum amplum]|uniref:F-box domain-containing protein n=1 Tax=Schizophyllum amplum TaxID=97359 RepID=A0A550BVW6_9AGAR|nr:hypothetical protein BD626DRAFT_635575 [Auriculariopsis ampla]
MNDSENTLFRLARPQATARPIYPNSATLDKISRAAMASISGYKRLERSDAPEKAVSAPICSQRYSPAGAAFASAEIRRRICTHLPAWDLCILARTSLRWEESTSPLLWSHLPSVRPIARLVLVEQEEVKRSSKGRINLRKYHYPRVQRFAAMVKKLSINSEDISHVLDFTSFCSTGLFPSLREVRLSGFAKNHGNVANLLPENLLILHANGVNSHVVHKLITSCRSLQSLHLQGDYITLSIPYSENIIPGLANCPSLRRIDLTFADNIDSASRTPPLRCVPDSAGINALPLTHANLVRLAKGCHRLEALCLVFDARGNPPRLTKKPSSFRRCLTTLVVRDSPIGHEDAGPVAHFLATLFPSLRDIVSSDSSYSPVWADVCDRIKSMSDRLVPGGLDTSSLGDGGLEGNAAVAQLPHVKVEYFEAEIGDWTPPESGPLHAVQVNHELDVTGNSTPGDQRALLSRQLNSEVEDGEVEQDTVESDMSSASLQQRYQANEDRLQARIHNLTEANNRVVQQKLDLAQRYEEVEQHSDAQGKSILRLERHIRDLGEVRATVDQQKGDLAQQRVALEKRYKDLEERANASEKRCMQLEERADAGEKKYLQAEERADASDKAYLRLERDIQVFRKEAAKNIDELTQGVEAIRQEKDVLQGRYDAQSKHAQEVEEEKRAAEQERELLAQRCAELEQWKADIKQRLQGLF